MTTPEIPDGYHARFIGGGIAGLGSPALICTRCACLLPYDEEAAVQVHNAWHERIEPTTEELS